MTRKTNTTGIAHMDYCLTYVMGVYDNQPKPLTHEMMERLLSMHKTKVNTEQYRATGNEQLKKALPAVLFNGLYSEERAAAWLRQDKHHTRRQDQCYLPSPFYGIDIDLKGCPEELYSVVRDRIKKHLGCEPEEILVMAYASPSRGLRLVVRRTPGLTLEQEICKWETLLGMPCDPTCKNPSRLYLLTSRDDILYYNPQALFSLEGHTPESFPSEAESTKYEMPKAEDSASEPADEKRLQGAYKHTAQGVRYTSEQLQDIAEELAHIIGGGAAQKGMRNGLTFEIAKQMRHIVGNDAENLSMVIPMYEESYKKHMDAINNALKYGKTLPYIPSDLQRAIDRAMAAENDTPTADEESTTPPQMPSTLPPSMETILTGIPMKSRPAVAMSVFSALRALMYNVKFKYINNTDQEPCFLFLCVADQGSGKTAIRPPLKGILHEVEKRDEISRQEEQLWREKCETLGANKDKPKRPTSPKQIVQANMTEASLVSLMRRADGHSLFTYGEELDKLLHLKGASEIIRSAFDCEQYGQERVGAGSICDVVTLKWSFVYSTTPATACKILKNEISNGTLSRLCLGTIECDADDWGEETPMFGDFDQEYIKAVDAFTSLLKQTPSGVFTCTEAMQWANEEKARQIDRLKMMDAKYLSPFLWRSLQMAFWRACMLYIMNGNKWSQEIEQFASWSLNYDLWVKLHYFGQMIENCLDTAQNGGRQPTMLLAQLPNTFTRDEARIMRRQQGRDASSRSLRNMLNTWVNRGFIRFDKETKLYTKLTLKTA
ncbi:MAG: DUF3987 domain-containing protein [Bacteroidaceae bacterium]|nr:DUF3987 domain-containing protein [Bacteroidaceae bacterium]